jgi:hypothetical protein
VAELNWYLFCTEEMPATVMENVLAQIRTLKRLHETADALLEASLQVVKEDLKATQEFVQEHASREYTPDFQGSSFDDNLVGTLGMDLPELDSNDDFKKKT